MNSFERGYNLEDLKLAKEIAEQTYKKFKENRHPDINLITAIGIVTSAKVEYMQGAMTKEAFQEVCDSVKSFLNGKGY